MDRNLLSRGRLSSLPRLKVSYRQFTKLLSIILSWVVLFFGSPATTFAFYPDEVGSFLSSVGQNAVSSEPKAGNSKTEAPAPASAANSVVPEIVIPEIKIEIASAEYIEPPTPPAPVIVARIASGGTFPFGQCTYYVATRRNVTWSGNAGQWYANASAQGYAVGPTPRAGSIMVTWESSLGHVAYVEYVNPDGSYVVSEMNNSALGGWGIVNQRTITPGSVPLIGFIY
jgi:CHAP domain